ncbi:hypothetical protein BOX15_Mlig012104g1, partial [Macrostomum lignano]
SKQLTRKRKSTDELELVARRLLGNKIVSPPAQRRLLSDWQFSDYFRSQSDALEYYKRCCHGDSCLEPSKLPPLVMSSESASLGYQGQRLYFVCDLQTGIDYLLGHPVGRRHLYELIPEGSRCRLYFDLEFDRLSNPDLDGSMATDILLGFIRNLLTVAFGDTGATHSDWMEAVQLDASTDQKFSRHVIFPNVGRPPSPYPEVDRHFLVTVMSNQGQLRMWSYCPANQILTLFPSNYRYCHRVERHHRSNHVYFLVNLVEQSFEQRCFDPDCHKYRSNAFPLPAELFPWNFLTD